MQNALGVRKNKFFYSFDHRQTPIDGRAANFFILKQHLRLSLNQQSEASPWNTKTNPDQLGMPPTNL